MSDAKRHKKASSKRHDPETCFCLFNCCTCPCDKCQGYRDRELTLMRLMECQGQLYSLGLDAEDLAEVVLIHIAPKLERYIRDEAQLMAANSLAELLSVDVVQKQLVELLFFDMTQIAIGVYEGFKSNARKHPRESSKSSARGETTIDASSCPQSEGSGTAATAP